VPAGRRRIAHGTGRRRLSPADTRRRFVVPVGVAQVGELLDQALRGAGPGPGTRTGSAVTTPCRPAGDRHPGPLPARAALAVPWIGPAAVSGSPGRRPWPLYRIAGTPPHQHDHIRATWHGEVGRGCPCGPFCKTLWRGAKVACLGCRDHAPLASGYVRQAKRGKITMHTANIDQHRRGGIRVSKRTGPRQPCRIEETRREEYSRWASRRTRSPGSFLPRL